MGRVFRFGMILGFHCHIVSDRILFPLEGIEELRVCDLIDPDTGDWNVWLLNELFIARIALSNGGGEDRMVWHFDNKGLYSVKSGYHVARMTNQQGNIASTSDSNSGTKALYKMVWGSNAPPKVRMHAWRLVRGIFPTRCALNKRVPLPDVRCVFCGFNGEDEKHVFMRCRVIQCFWNQGPFYCKVGESWSVEEVIEWAAVMLEKLTKEQAARFLMALWVIWDTRDDDLWNRGSYDLGHMQRKAEDLLMEYQKFHGRKTKWVCPPQGRLKISVDGGFQESHKRGGIGVVVRNEHGVCMAALAQPLEYIHIALQVEAEAFRAGILIAIHQAWEMVEIESDCSMLVDALHRDEEDLSTNQDMLMLGWAKASKCKKLLKQVRSRLECLQQERFATSMQLRQDLDQKIDYEALNLRIEQEQHIRDESSAYDLLDYFCKLILKHLFYIRTHKQCRQRNLAEAVSCLVFASSRLTCGVIPELGEIRDLFGERYGESFVDTAVKLLPGNLVNPIFKKNIIALSPPDSTVPTDVIVKHKPVKPSFTSSSPDQAPERSSEQKKDDDVQCPKNVHPKLPDWDDIYTQLSVLSRSLNM
ncbi:hypothetical protein ACLB2K_059654 [Fragaria x ananassa]